MTPTCACRPSCLSTLRPDDRLTVTPAGPVLVAHLTVRRLSTVGLTSLTSPLSKARP